MFNRRLTSGAPVVFDLRSTRTGRGITIFTNALISVNWSGTSVDAAALGRCLCADDARLTLAHVHGEVPMSPDPLVMRLRKLELRHSTRALEDAAFATKIKPTLSVSAPLVSDGLNGLLSMIGADLLVVGPVDGYGAAASELAEWWLARSAATASAIAIANQGFARAPMLRRIGVIRNESQASESGVATAEELAGRFGSRPKVFELPSTHDTPGPRRRAIAARRLAEFSVGVDLLVSSVQDLALSDGVKAPLLLVKRPIFTGPQAVAPAPATRHAAF